MWYTHVVQRMNLERLFANANALLPCSFFIFLVGCSTHHDFKWQDKSGLGANIVHGVAVEKSILYSFTSLPGEYRLSPEAYVLDDESEVIKFYHSPKRILDSKTFLREPCCSLPDSRSVRNVIDSTQAWVLDLFDTNQKIQLELVLVPHEYRYQYSSSYPIKSGVWTARFGVRYDEENVTKSTAKISEIIGHELSHILSKAQGKSRKNALSDEVTATLVGICAAAELDENAINDPISIKADEASMQRFRTNDYADNINALRDNDITLIAGMIVTLATKKILAQSRKTGETAISLLGNYCERVVIENHDFELSLGLNFET